MGRAGERDDRVPARPLPAAAVPGEVAALLAASTEGWLLLDAAPGAASDDAPPHLRVRHANPAALVLLQRPGSGVVGAGLRDLLPPAAADLLLRRCAQVLAGGAPDGQLLDREVLEGAGALHAAVVPHAGGLAVRLVPASAPSSVQLPVHDLMATTLDGFAVLSVVRDAAGRVADLRVDYVNRAGVLPGSDPRRAVGRSLPALLRPLGAEEVLRHCREVAASGQARRATVHLHPAAAAAVGAAVPDAAPSDAVAPDDHLTYEVQLNPTGPDSLTVSYRDVSAEVRQRRLLERSTRRARAAAERAVLLLDTASALSQAVTLEAVQRVIMQRTPAVLGCDGTMVCLLEDQRLVVSHVSGYPDEFIDALRDPAKLAACPVADAAATGRVHFVETPAQLLERFPDAEFVLHTQQRRAWASLPLVVSGRVIGGWSVAYAAERVFDDDERRLLRTLASHYAQALERARLHGIAHSTAVQLQRALLPAEDLSHVGLPLATHYVPAAEGFEVGGDFYSVIPLPSGSIAVAIGDVSGHNLAAAAVMGQVRNALHAYALEGHSPAGVVERVNRLMATMQIPQFATCTYLELQPDTGAVTVVLAGHPAPVVRPPGGQAHSLDVDPDPPLGVDPELRCAEHTLLLAPGSLLFLFTDGLVESRRESLDVGLQRLRRVLQRMPPVPRRVVDEVVPAMLRDQPQEDDIAVLAVRVPARSGSSARISRLFPSDPASVGAARHFVTDVLQAWSLEEVADEAEILTSEVVTNAVLHTTEGVELTVERLADAVRVEVADSSVRMPELREVGEDAMSGRGLHIVDVLARSWGVEPTESGKVVHFELSAPAVGQERGRR